MKRRPFVAGNWKMHGSLEMTAELATGGAGDVRGWLDRFPRSRVQPDDLLDAAAGTHTGVLLGARLSPRDPAADQLVVIAEGLVEGRGNVGR